MIWPRSTLLPFDDNILVVQRLFYLKNSVQSLKHIEMLGIVLISYKIYLSKNKCSTGLHGNMGFFFSLHQSVHTSYQAP